MGAEYYLFALFVFALAAMLVVLILRGRNKNKAKEEEEQEEREKKLMMVYFEVEDMIEALKEYVEASREKIEADIRRIETDMHALSAVRGSFDVLENKLSRQAMEIKDEVELHALCPENAVIDTAEDAQKEGLRLSAVNMVAQGKNVDQIAEQMQLSKTEVALMINLDKYRTSEEEK